MAVAVLSGIRSLFKYKERVAQAVWTPGRLSPGELLEAPMQGMNHVAMAGLTLKPLSARLMNRAMPMSPVGRHGTNILPPGRRAVNQWTGGLTTPAFT
jgi:hypothetical protein